MSDQTQDDITPAAGTQDAGLTPTVPDTVVTQDGGAPAIPDPAAAPTGDIVPVKHEETGDPGLDLALEFIGNLGIGPDDPAVAAARNGDFAQIEAKLAALGDKAKGYKRHVALVKDIYEREQKAASGKGAEILKAVSDAVGGEDRWKMIAQWAGQEATPAQRLEVNAALAAGGLAAKAVARELARQFDARVGKTPANAVRDGAPAAVGGASPITGKEYGRAVAELSVKYPGKDITTMPEYLALRSRRIASQQAGVK